MKPRIRHHVLIVYFDFGGMFEAIDAWSCAIDGEEHVRCGVGTTPERAFLAWFTQPKHAPLEHAA